MVETGPSALFPTLIVSHRIRVHPAASAWLHRALICYVIAMLFAFLLPIPNVAQAEANHLDKVVHFGIFFGFSLLLWLDQHLSAGWIFLATCGFAGAVELLQRMVPYRHGDWSDFAAGAFGGLLAMIAVLWLERREKARPSLQG
jgi:VanZ family protein